MDITDSYQVCTHLSQSDGIGKKMQHIPYCKMPVFPILGAEKCYAIIYLIKCDWVPFVLDTNFTASLEQQLPEFRHLKNEIISRHQDIFTEEQLHACVRLLKLATYGFYSRNSLPLLVWPAQCNSVSKITRNIHLITLVYIQWKLFLKFCIFFFLPIDLLLPSYSSRAYWPVFTWITLF